MKKSNQEESRQHNSRLVLSTIYQSGEISRVEIARQTHLTRTTVSEIVAEFVEAGLVIETGLAPSTGGKPATLLRVAKNARLLVGIDLAEQEFCGALVNLRGEIVQRLCLPVADSSAEAALEQVYELIEQLLGLADQTVISDVSPIVVMSKYSWRALAEMNLLHCWKKIPHSVHRRLSTSLRT